MEQNRTGSPISNFWTHCYVLLIAYLFIILFYFIDLFIFFAYCFFQDVFALEMGKLLNSQLSDYHLAITMWSKYGQNIGGILNLQDAWFVIVRRNNTREYYAIINFPKLDITLFFWCFSLAMATFLICMKLSGCISIKPAPVYSH